MKQTVFSKTQKTLLQELLNKRYKDYSQTLVKNNLDKADRKRFENYYIKPLISALLKMKYPDTTDYTSNEKNVLISCVNEHYSTFKHEMPLSTPHSLLAISDDKRKLIAKIDDCKDILYKCGYYKLKDVVGKYKTEFRYRNYIIAIDKLKKADKIFLSKVGDNDFYKIAFVYENKEYMTLELKRQICWSDFAFISLHGASANTLGYQNFSLVTTKSKAKELLLTCERNYYPDGVLDFINVLLN